MKKLGSRIVAVAMGAMLASACFAGTAFATSSSRVGDATGDSSCIDRPAAKVFISKKTAKRIAFEDAGVKKKRCSDISVDLRKRAKKNVYIVRFTYKEIMKYHYTIAAKNGKVLAYYAKHV